MNKTCIILCAFHTYFPFILSALSSQNPVQIFQNYINIDWLCNMSIPSCLDCFFYNLTYVKKTASIIRLRYTMHKKNITAQYLYLPMHISDIKCNLIGQSLFRRFQLISQNFPDISDTVQHRIAMRIQFCCHSLNTSIMLQI